ncbi:MAG TPA: zf-HC2 domain-containing protein [Bryobacteraceae bacterium]|jgi:anti-sigma-K factor RskA|nr:zf-HC2 domain-containing protein [Bryobacteraceae bacterium]
MEPSQEITCPQKSDDGAGWIVAYVARTLDSGSEAAFERHLESCASCREMVAAQRAVWSALEALPAHPVSSNFDSRLYQRIAEEEQSAWWRRLFQAGWSWRPAMPVAAACAVLAVAFLVKNSGPSILPQQQVQPQLQIEQVERALDDMDMLKQAGVEFALDKNTPQERM